MSASPHPETPSSKIPGAHWLRADLHVPLGGDGRGFCDAVIAADIDVVGLVPSGDNAAALWDVVQTWREGRDAKGKPYRDQIFALFVGMEIVLGEGRHLLLCDPEIGRAHYDALGEQIAKGAGDAVRVWQILQARGRQSGADRWDALLFGIASGPAELDIAATQLGAEILPEDLHDSTGPFFHASGSTPDGKVGDRVTWLKLGTPRIEALRQAFVAAGSRVRLAYARSATGPLSPMDDAPDRLLATRPWFRSLTVRGGASFFAGINEDGTPREARFAFSPDLTCIIGSNMTGKSTLLDGLRVVLDAPLPTDETLRQQVHARGRGLFLSGAPEVVLEDGAGNETAEHGAQTALFYSQNELQQLAASEAAAEALLGGLLAAETLGIETRRKELALLDDDAVLSAERLELLEESLEEAEQSYERAASAKAELNALGAASLERLHEARRAHHAWQAASLEAGQLLARAEATASSALALKEPALDDVSLMALRSLNLDPQRMPFSEWRERAGTLLSRSQQDLAGWRELAQRTEAALMIHASTLEQAAEGELAAQGLGPAELTRYRVASGEAAELFRHEATRDRLRAELAAEEQRFFSLRATRQTTEGLQREAYDRIIAELGDVLSGDLVVERLEAADTLPLERFIRGLAKSSITRWWNQLRDEQRRSLAVLVPAQTAAEEPLRLAWERLGETGMSAAVQRSFRELMTRGRVRELAAIRCPDRYRLSLRVGEGEARELAQLSGGQRVGVVLALLLETHDARPLIIDQPEDEIDKRFLVERVLPALSKLEGRRQVILATHDANLVVNGNAGQVIHLEATATRGQVAVAGPIEHPAVRAAIVHTVDGGEAAFSLRAEKYGF